jgi:hypothetical protein
MPILYLSDDELKGATRALLLNHSSHSNATTVLGKLLVELARLNALQILDKETA